MLETAPITKTYKLIDDDKTVICIEEVEAILYLDIYIEMEKRVYYVRFYLKSGSFYDSKRFDTREEAVKFSETIMGWW